MTGPCAKTRVVCTLVTPSGARFVGENLCRNPQPACPREPGEGYEKCRRVCDQIGHAEVVAITSAAGRALAATAYIEGHTYACDDCRAALERAGVTQIVIGSPPAAAKSDTRDE